LQVKTVPQLSVAVPEHRLPHGLPVEMHGHRVVLYVLTQPDPGLHESAVQALLSLHETAEFTQPDPGLHESDVQTLPSLQESAVFRQPVCGLHASAVQALPSLHERGLFTQPVSG
jgi:hypothetical protein